MGRKLSKGDALPLPPGLAAALETAKANQVPQEGSKDAEECPRLFELLAPREVTIPAAQEGGKAKQVIRQPMLMAFWDAGVGAWAVGVTDKTLGVKVTCCVPSLVNLTALFETALQSGKVSVKSLEKD